MTKNTKTVGDLVSADTCSDPLNSLKRESIERMRTALLASSLDDPMSAVSAVRQVTIMRVYHQVSRIVQYLDIMDKLEAKLYESIQVELSNLDMTDNNFSSLSKLLAVQEKLQKAVIESNKLLAPYLDMEQYPAFNTIEVSTPVSDKVLDVPEERRNALRENAEAILSELSELPQTNKATVCE